MSDKQIKFLLIKYFAQFYEYRLIDKKTVNKSVCTENIWTVLPSFIAIPKSTNFILH